MVNNSYYKCKYCGCPLRLRYQVGAFDLPVSVYCPKCNSHISGTIFVDNENIGIKEQIIGATQVSGDDYDYVVELSTEFLVNKCKKRDETTDVQISMFLRSDSLNAKRNERRARLLEFANEANNHVSRIENIYNLLEKGQVDLIKNYFLNSEDYFLIDVRKEKDFTQIKTELDAMLATKHYLNSVLQPIMPDDVFSNIFDILNNKTKRIASKHTLSLIEYLKYLSDDYFQTYLFRIPKFITDYIKQVKQLIPIYDNYDRFDKIDLASQGISTMSIDDMTVIYKKGFELLCDSIDLLIGLYNIEERGSYDNFEKGLKNFDEELNKYSSKFNKYEAFINNESDLFFGLKGVLNNIIRNAEGHNSIRVDGLNQNVTFVNNHRGVVKDLTISFLEFGKICIDLFVAILYVWEYYYQFTKLKYVLVDGKKLNYGLEYTK